MTISVTHHPILVSIIHARNGEVRIREYWHGNALIIHLLLDCVKCIGSDTHHGVDAKVLECTLLPLNIFHLIPAGLTSQAFLEVEEDCFAAKSVQIKGTTISRCQMNGWSLLARTRTAHLEHIVARPATT